MCVFIIIINKPYLFKLFRITKYAKSMLSLKKKKVAMEFSACQEGLCDVLFGKSVSPAYVPLLLLLTYI